MESGSYFLVILSQSRVWYIACPHLFQNLYFNTLYFTSDIGKWARNWFWFMLISGVLSWVSCNFFLDTNIVLPDFDFNLKILLIGLWSASTVNSPPYNSWYIFFNQTQLQESLFQFEMISTVLDSMRGMNMQLFFRFAERLLQVQMN